MDKLNLPGFTAEGSLDGTSRRYRGKTTYTTNSTQIEPQFPQGLCTKAAYYCNRGYRKWCNILEANCESEE